MQRIDIQKQFHTESTETAFHVVSRSDLICKPQIRGMVTFWMIKDPISRAYFYLEAEHYELLQLLDGKRNLKEILRLLKQSFRNRSWTSIDLLSMITDLADKQLVVVNKLFEQETETGKSFSWKSVASGKLPNPLFFRFPGWNPNFILQLLLPFFQWMYWSRVQISLLAFAAFSTIVILAEQSRFWSEMATTTLLPTPQNFFSLWLALGVSKAIHELSHGLQCRVLKAEVHQMGLAMMVFSPCLYCNVSDAWNLDNRWHRIKISLAGLYAELLLGSVAIWFWILSEPGIWHTFLAHLIGVAFFSTFIVNLNPLLKFDGYYVLCDLIEVHNLRGKSKKLMDHYLAYWLVGLPIPRSSTLPAKRHGGYLFYHVASVLYTFLILFSISEMLRYFMRPAGLEWLSFFFLINALGMMALRWLVPFLAICQQTKEVSMNKPRIFISWTTVGLLLYALCFVSYSHSSNAPLVASPKTIRHILLGTPGELKNTFVTPGEGVESGQLLIELDRQELKQRRIHLQANLEKQKVSTRLYVKTQAQDQEIISKKIEQQLQRQIETLEKEQQELSIRSPAHGTVLLVSSETSSELSSGEKKFQPQDSLFHPSNRGKFLGTQTPIAQLVNPAQWELTVLVTEEQKQILHVGQEIEFLLDAQPEKTHQAKVKMISDRPENSQTLGISQSEGNGVTGKIIQYAVTLEWKSSSLPVLANLHGHAFIQHPRQTVAMQVGNYLKKNYFARH